MVNGGVEVWGLGYGCWSRAPFFFFFSFLLEWVPFLHSAFWFRLSMGSPFTQRFLCQKIPRATRVNHGLLGCPLFSLVLILHFFDGLLLCGLAIIICFCHGSVLKDNLVFVKFQHALLALFQLVSFFRFLKFFLTGYRFLVGKFSGFFPF